MSKFKFKKSSAALLSASLGLSIAVWAAPF